MSAFILDTDHIDLMVSAAMRGHGIDHGLRVFRNGNVEDYDLRRANELGQILHDYNVHSVNYRYNEQTEPERYVYNGNGITPNLGGALIPWGQVLNAIQCYEYQSCEDTQDWPQSLAHEICRALRLKVCNFIAKEAEAEWVWERRHMEKREQEIRERIYHQVGA